MERMKRLAGVWLVVLVVGAGTARAEKRTLDGYAEWRHGHALIVDGQRLHVSARTKFEGKGDARELHSIPLGYEVKAEADRQADGSWLARKIEAKPNGSAMFESELRASFDVLEQAFRDEGVVYEEDDDGEREEYGRLLERGPQVSRVRRIVRRLMPAYFEGRWRVYVVENDEWNALAAPNGSIFVFTGLLENLSDDELAMILGHEIAHVTHEHGRRQAKKGLLTGLLVAGAVVVADELESDVLRTVVQAGAFLGGLAWQNGYGRALEDQADRVGMRYAREAGYDVTCAPALWQRFADKYGQLPKAVHFFLDDHSRSSDRADRLAVELRWNYPDATGGADMRMAQASADAEEVGGEGHDHEDEYEEPAPPVRVVRKRGIAASQVR